MLLTCLHITGTTALAWAARTGSLDAVISSLPALPELYPPLTLQLLPRSKSSYSPALTYTAAMAPVALLQTGHG